VEIGNGSDKIGKLANGIVERSSVRWRGMHRSGEKDEGEANQGKENAERGTVKNGSHGVLS
jgi:hypothetical protein